MTDTRCFSTSTGNQWHLKTFDYSVVCGCIWKSTLILFITVAVSACWQPDPRLTDPALKENFSRTETVLNKLLEMQYQDPKVMRIAPTFTRVDWQNRYPGQDMGFSDARWGEYRALFRTANLEEGLSAWEIGSGHGTVIFSIAHGVGYLYAESTPPKDHVFNSLVECNAVKPKLIGACLIPIKENWYLYRP